MDIERKCDRHWPICPRQLTTDRENCVHCKHYDGDNPDKNICKGMYCGVATKYFIRGTLLDVYDKHRKYPVVLIENVCCQGIEATDAYKAAVQEAGKPDNADRFVPFPDAHYSDYYVKQGPDGQLSVFYVYDLSKHFVCPTDGQCNGRRMDPAFKAECTQADLRACSEIMHVVNNHAELPTRYRECKTSGIESTYFEYRCNRNDVELVELAFPIIIDGWCVAVMLVGQIPLDDWKNCGGIVDIINYDKKVGMTIQGEIGEAAKEVSTFNQRMQERADLRRTDYLYRLLARLSDEIISNKGKKFERIIDEAYMMLSEHFACEELRLIFSRFEGEKELQEIAYPSSAKEMNISFTKIHDAMSKGDAELIKLYDPQETGRTRCYCQYSSVQDNRCLLLTVVRWQDAISGEEQKHIKTFFNTLNAMLFTMLMTELTKKMQREIEAREVNQLKMTHDFAHELNQKLEIIDTHTRLLEIKQAEWGFARSGRAHTDLKDYIKDITNLETMLRHFSNQLVEYNDSLVDVQSIQRRSFQPYSKFIFNLQEYYDTQNQDRRLYMPSVSYVTRYSGYYPSMRADPALIERCVNNLLSNAFKYSYNYSNIFLDCYRDGGNYIIEVMNFSPPIQKDIRDRMFVRGVSQSKLRNYRNPRGMGYGLAIVRQICHLHGGEVEAILDDKPLSSYNVVVLNRVIQEIGNARRMGKSKEALQRLRITEAEYLEYEREFDRLIHTPASPNNHLAEYYGIHSLLAEICNAIARPIDTLTSSSIQMAIRTGTERVIFRITLPQEGR